MFDLASIGIVGDANKIMPVLADALKSAKK